MLTSFLQLQLDLASEARDQNLPFTGVPLASTPGIFVSRILSAVMAIAAVIVLIALVSGAFDWITAGGDKGKIEKAREKMTQAVIGMFVLASVLMIFSLLQVFLGINILNLNGTGSNTGSSGIQGSGSAVNGSSGTRFFNNNSTPRDQKQPQGFIPPQEQDKTGSTINSNTFRNNTGANTQNNTNLNPEAEDLLNNFPEVQ